MPKLVRQPLAETVPCVCGCLVRITWLGGDCYSCGADLEPLGPKFQRQLAEIRNLPEPDHGS